MTLHVHVHDLFTCNILNCIRDNCYSCVAIIDIAENQLNIADATSTVVDE
jgi:hypothetical protein